MSDRDGMGRREVKKLRKVEMVRFNRKEHGSNTGMRRNTRMKKMADSTS